MATLVFVDQENGDVAATTLLKNRLKQTTSAKTLLKAHPGKVFGSSGTVAKPRKALGNVNKQVVNMTGPYQKCALKVKMSGPVSKQTSEATIKPSRQSYPEIEKCLPYDPADFETFDAPEEHKLSNLYLAGIPLFVQENEATALLNQLPAPMDIPVFSWESDMLSTLPSLLAMDYEITLELPQMVTC